MVLAIALGVGILGYGAAYVRSGDHRVQQSVEHLDELVANSPELEQRHAWYEEPINVALAGTTITLAFGGFALMLEHARLEEFPWPGTVGRRQTSEEPTADRAM